jgi:AIG2-like family
MITMRAGTAHNLVNNRRSGLRLSFIPVPLYAAYGSNMHPEQMLQRAPHSPMAGTGWLHGWRLTFGGEDIGWEGALATVVEDPDAKVFVVLYDMSAADESKLDQWEGSEFLVHKKIRCRVHRESSDTTTDPVLAWLYVLDAWEGGIPSARYLGVMADAAETAGAPSDYVHDLRTRPARNIGPGT